MLIVFIFAVECGLLLLLIFKQELDRLDPAKLACNHQGRDAFIVRVVDDLTLLDQELKNVRVLVCHCVMDQVTTLAIGLEAGWVHAEEVAENGRVRVDACEVHRDDCMLIRSCLDKCLPLENLNRVGFCALKDRCLMKPAEPVKRTIALLYSHDVLQERKVTATRCLGPKLDKLSLVKEAIIIFLEHWSLVLIFAFGAQHDLDKVHGRAQLEDVFSVYQRTIPDLVVVGERIIALLAASGKLDLPCWEVERVFVAVTRALLLERNVSEFDALDVSRLGFAEVVNHELEHCSVLLLDDDSDDVDLAVNAMLLEGIADVLSVLKTRFKSVQIILVNA